MKITTLLLVSAILVSACSSTCVAAGLAVGPVSDSRYTVIRNTATRCNVQNLYSQYRKPEDWKARAAQLRAQLLGSAGLVPLPVKTPLNAKVFGMIDRGDYTVEKVYFESYPGLYVTGNLYRPKGEGPFPAVLNPHGHWDNQRFENSDLCSVPGRCINMAKQGYVAFSYDMIGYGDSWQVVHSVYPGMVYGNAGVILHGEKPDMARDVIGFMMSQKLWGISAGALQLWNSIRSIDFLQSLPYVDKDRIACTGASGGATQTYMVAVADDRIKAAAPVNMISVESQGGCMCENPPNLRVDTNNVEFVAAIAPRPLLMVCATGDWTKETLKVAYPAVKHIYELFGTQERVTSVEMDAPHNYNKDSREAVYSFFAKWLPKTPLPQPVKEQPFEMEKISDLRVFPEGQPPAGALGRDALVDALVGSAKAQLEANRPVDRQNLSRLRKMFGPALKAALSINSSPDPKSEARGSENNGDWTVHRLVLSDQKRKTAIPALMFQPAKTAKHSQAVLLVDENGKSSFVTGGQPGPIVSDMLMKGRRVLLIDCFATGENTAPEGAPKRSPHSDPDDTFFDTYNRNDVAEQVYDIVTSLKYLSATPGVSGVSMVGTGRAGLWCLLARPFAPKVKLTIADVAAFDSSNDESFVKALYVPCLRRAGDFKTAIAMNAPDSLVIHNTQGSFDTTWAEDTYKAAGASNALRVRRDRLSEKEIARVLTTPLQVED